MKALCSCGAYSVQTLLIRQNKHYTAFKYLMRKLFNKQNLVSRGFNTYKFRQVNFSWKLNRAFIPELFRFMIFAERRLSVMGGSAAIKNSDLFLNDGYSSKLFFCLGWGFFTAGGLSPSISIFPSLVLSLSFFVLCLYASFPFFVLFFISHPPCLSFFFFFLSRSFCLSFISLTLFQTLSHSFVIYSLSLSLSLSFILYITLLLFLLFKNHERNKRKIIFTLLAFWIILGRKTTSVHWLMEYRRV